MEQGSGENSSVRSLLIIVGSLIIAITAAWWLNSRGADNGPDKPTENSGPGDGAPTIPEVQDKFQPPNDADLFVGSAACAECHSDLFESYQQHPMARSTRRIDTADDVLQLKPANTTIDGNGHRFEVLVDAQAKTLIHRDRFLNSTGESILNQDVEMPWVMGSGRRAHAFLFQDAGQIFMSPLNWYAEGNRWDMAPNYTPDDARRFDRRATDDCLHCHAGRAAVKERGSNRFQKQPFHETAIGCERCHGPGKNHVDFQNGIANVTDDIVNPSGLKPYLRESVCYQCHLHSDARVLRNGRSHFDFRPGMSLDEIWAVFDAADSSTEHSGGIESIHHVQQMRASECFKKSDGQLGCISCHDSHGLPSPEEREPFYNNRCANCHESAACSETAQNRAASNDSCIVCHMPSASSANMAHVSVTDHRVLKRPRTVGANKEKQKSSKLEFFANSQSSFSKSESNRLRAIATTLHMNKLGRPAPASIVDDLRTAVNESPSDADALTALAVIASQQGRTADAEHWYTQAVPLPSAAEVSLESLLNMSYSRGELDQAVDFADRLLAIFPRNARVLAVRADLYRLEGDWKSAVQAGEQSLQINPTLHSVREWLIGILKQHDQTDRAEFHQNLLNQLRSAAN